MSLTAGAFVLGCAAVGPTTASDPAAELDPTSAVSSTIATTARVAKAEKPAEELTRLLILKSHIRMVDCGHDEPVGDLKCAYNAAAEDQPVEDAQRLRLFLTVESGLVLAAVEWQPAHKLADADAVMADCRFEQLGSLRDVHLGGATAIKGYLYLSTLPVGRATECSFDQYDSLPPVLSAAHLLLAHLDSHKKPRKTTRSRAEAIALARKIANNLDAATISFSEAVTKYTDEPGGAKRAGDLGRFRRGAMSPEFELILLSTKPGKRSPAFETAWGFHVLERR